MRAPFGPFLLLRLARDRRGASAVEFALIAPMLCLLLAGLTDGSRFIVQTMQVRAAAQAGADFALDHPFDPARVQAAVIAATSLSVQPDEIVATQGASCVVNKVVVQAGCPANANAGGFVRIVVQHAFKPLLPWPGLPRQSITTAQAQVRIA